MKKVLITGVRAPAAIDLARLLSISGIDVYMADSFRFPIGRFSKYLKGYQRIPGPAIDPKGFVRELCKTIKKFEIDLLIPTCEEVFFIGRYQKEFPCAVFCDDFAKLETLHNKYQFTLEAKGCEIEIPKTKLITSKEELMHCETKGYVFKPVYSRFASHTFIQPRKKKLKKLKISKKYPWVQQEFIPGKEYCSYSIAVEGNITAHSCYHPLYRFGKGAGIYFPPVHNEIILNFVQKFAKKINFTGQLGFDFIEKNSEQLYVLECNPRTTSGVHLLDKNINFHQVFTPNNNILIKSKDQAKMITIAMLLCGWQQKSPRIFWSDFNKATGILNDNEDKISSIALFINLVEVIIRSICRFKSIQQASTYDIEWNGQQL